MNRTYSVFAFVSCFGKRCFDCFLEILWKNSKKKSTTDYRRKKNKILGFFPKDIIFLPRCSGKESCKKWFNSALWAKSIKLDKKCISVYVITKMNGNHFLPSSMKQAILKQKIKNHFHEIFVVVWFDTHSYRELTIFAKVYLLKRIK